MRTALGKKHALRRDRQSKRLDSERLRETVATAATLEVYYYHAVTRQTTWVKPPPEFPSVLPALNSIEWHARFQFHSSR